MLKWVYYIQFLLSVCKISNACFSLVHSNFSTTSLIFKFTGAPKGTKIYQYMPSWIICLGPKICQFIKLIQCQVPTQYLVRLVRLNRFQIIVQVSHFSKEALMQDNPSSSLFLSVLQKKYAGPIPQPPSTTYQIFSNTNDIYLVRDQQNLSLLFEEEEKKFLDGFGIVV